MTVRLNLIPHLRLPISSFSTMRPNPPFKPSRVIPVFFYMLPHRLKYQSFSKRVGFARLLTHQNELAVRRFSTRSSRMNSGEEVRASKSLIDDEAELSDWVRGLNSKSYRLYSDSDDDSKNRSSDRNVRSRDERGGERRRESGSDDYGVSQSRRQRGGRDSHGSFSQNSRGKGSPLGRARDQGIVGFKRGGGRRGLVMSDEDDDDDDSDDVRSRDERGGERRRESGSDDYGVSQSRRQRGGRDSHGSFSQNSRRKGSPLGRGREQGIVGFKSGGGRRGLVMSDEDDDDDGDDVRSVDERGGERRRESGFDDYGVSQSRRQRGGRDSHSSFSQNSRGKGSPLGRTRDQGIVGFKRGGGTRGLVMSVEDDNDDGDDKVKGLRWRELVSEEDSEEIEDDKDEVVFKTPNSFSRKVSEDSQPVSPTRGDSYLSETRFDQCSISPLSLKGIKDAGYEKMTVVQEATLPVILKGNDVLAKAKTGTGKTVAFLLPSIEVIVKSTPISRDQKWPPILVLVVCPTRELATQAAAEANTLLKYHPTVGVQVVIGGTRLALEQKRMQTNPCQILVATPGRLRDHSENTAGFATRLMGVKVLVLDEADHLLDMGFRKDIEKIVAAVPKQRQTLLFSATVPEEVRQVSHIALKRDHEFINTVQEGAEETHSQVKQMHLVAPLDKHFSLLYSVLKEHIADNVDYKVLVFCTTAMVTKLVAELLGELKLNIREIHSRKAQNYRTRVSDEFRKSKGLVLVTSDVSARGVDYPDVTLVIQVGLPADREQYIHRLGRTGRKGKEGLGILLLAPWEEFFLSTVKDLPITKAPVPSVDPDTRKKVESALYHVQLKSKESAYQAWLGYYNSSKGVGRDKCKLVELANEFSQSMGLDNPPAIPILVLNKMGLRKIPGLRSR